jgi:hypothetical protein
MKRIISPSFALLAVYGATASAATAQAIRGGKCSKNQQKT